MSTVLREIATARTALVVVPSPPSAISAPSIETEGEVATATSPSSSANSDLSGSMPFDEDGPHWPDAAAEAAFLASNPYAASDTKTLTPADAREDDRAPLPSLDSLIAKIPPAARDLLDELFRARFMTVRKVHAAHLTPRLP